jgi:hypothetical protein
MSSSAPKAPVSRQPAQETAGRGQAQLDQRPSAAAAAQLQAAMTTSFRLVPQQELQTAIAGSPRQLVQRQANRTGLPDQLKQGVENLSGYALDDVRVHYNSASPAQLQAHAYAQGTDIHVAPGQEQHLPHEAWHVVQQKQGRVRATTQLKGGAAVNDNHGLEQEADVMGAAALSLEAGPVASPALETEVATPVVQRKLDDAIIVLAHTGTNTRLPYSTEGIIETLAELGRNVSADKTVFNVLRQALLKDLSAEEQSRIEQALTLAAAPAKEQADEGMAVEEGGAEAPVSLTMTKQEGRVFNKPQTGDNGAFFTRMIIVSLAEKFQGYDVHLSYFPASVFHDPWNIEYNSSMLSKEQSIAEANAAAGDISDHTTMDYGEFHVTYGKGTDSAFHFFFDKDAGFLRETGSGGPAFARHAQQVATWSLTL